MNKIKYDTNEQLKIYEIAKYMPIPSTNEALTAFRGNDNNLYRMIAFYRLYDRLEECFSDNNAAETCPPYEVDWEKMGIEDIEIIDYIRETVKMAFRYGYYRAMQDNGEKWND